MWARRFAVIIWCSKLADTLMGSECRPVVVCSLGSLALGSAEPVVATRPLFCASRAQGFRIELLGPG